MVAEDINSIQAGFDLKFQVQRAAMALIESRTVGRSQIQSKIETMTKANVDEIPKVDDYGYVIERNYDTDTFYQGYVK